MRLYMEKGVVDLTNRRLKDFVNFIPGINQSRAENQFTDYSVQYYDQSAFESDFCLQNYVKEDMNRGELPDQPFLRAGDIIISNTKQAATIVGKANEGKVLPINFTKVKFLNEGLDKRYFLFLFNSYKDVQRQKERENQGTGAIQKIPLRSLGELQIPYITMSEQKLIGDSYVEMLMLQNKLKRCSELNEILTCAILEKSIEERQ